MWTRQVGMQENPVLSETDIERDRVDGYVVPDYRVPEGVIPDIRARHDRLIAGHPDDYRMRS